MSVWLDTFSASVPSAIGTPAASSSGHLPVCVVPLASFSAELGFCEIRAPESATNPTSRSSRLVMWLSRVRSLSAPIAAMCSTGRWPNVASSTSTSRSLVDLCSTNSDPGLGGQPAAPRVSSSEQVPTPSMVTASLIRG